MQTCGTGAQSDWRMSAYLWNMAPSTVLQMQVWGYGTRNDLAENAVMEPAELIEQQRGQLEEWKLWKKIILFIK